MRNQIFSAIIRSKQYYIKALDVSCAANLLQQYGLGFKDLKPAPGGHSKEAFVPQKIRFKIDEENRNRRRNKNG